MEDLFESDGTQKVQKVVDLRKEVRYGPDHHPQYEGESNSGESITEQTYVPIEEQIQEMIRSGEFLEEYRRAWWDFGPGEEVDEEFDDVTRAPGFDAADAHLILARLMGKRDQDLARERAAVAAKVKAEAEAESSPLVDNPVDNPPKGGV